MADAGDRPHHRDDQTADQAADRHGDQRGHQRQQAVDALAGLGLVHLLGPELDAERINRRSAEAERGS